MMPFASLVGLSLTLAACAPLKIYHPIYHRPGFAVTRMRSDQTTCEVAALRDAPVASQIRQRPPVFVPGRQICKGTACRYVPGYWVDGEIYSVDVNAGLRDRVEQRCMVGKGYQQVSVPLCKGSVKAAVVPRQTRVLPALSDTACVIRHEAGVWQIVNPVIAGQ